MLRTVRTAAALMLLLAVACGGSSTDTPAATEEPSPATQAVDSPLVGTWTRETTCEELVVAFEEAGLEEFTLDHVAGNEFIPGVSSPDDIEDPAHPCEGAVPKEHSHFFTEDGEFGSLDAEGDQVDDGTYELIDESTFVVSKEFPDVTFHFEIRGDTLFLDPVIPECASEGCFEGQWAITVAYPGLGWERST